MVNISNVELRSVTMDTGSLVNIIPLSILEATVSQDRFVKMTI